MIGLIKGTMRSKKALAGLPLPIASFRTNGNSPLTACTLSITPVQSGSGDPYPAGGGVNKWDEVWEVGSIDTTTGNNSIDNNVIRSKNYIPCIPNTNYYCTVNPYRWFVYDNNKNFIGTLEGNRAFTTPPNAYFIRFRLYASYGTTYNNDISVNYPSTDTSYHPTANIRPISGWNSVKVSAVKQLFNGTLENGSFNTGTGEKIPSTTRVRSVDDIPLPSGSYVLNNLNGWQFVLYVYDLEGNFKSSESYISWKDNPLSFSLVADRKINFAIRNDTNTTIVPSDVIGLTLYDSTVGQTATIPLPHTVYGGELDIVSGNGSETWSDKFTVDGSVSVFNVSQSGGVYYISVRTDLTGINTTSSDKTVISDKMKTATGLATDNHCYITNGGATLVCILSDQTITTKEQANQWFSDNPTTFCYRLATPTELTTSPVALNARNGTNNVWADAGDISEIGYAVHQQYIGR